MQVFAARSCPAPERAYLRVGNVEGAPFYLVGDRPLEAART
jgi:hypothetical protein